MVFNTILQQALILLTASCAAIFGQDIDNVTSAIIGSNPVPDLSEYDSLDPLSLNLSLILNLDAPATFNSTINTWNFCYFISSTEEGLSGDNIYVGVWRPGALVYNLVDGSLMALPKSESYRAFDFLCQRFAVPSFEVQEGDVAGVVVPAIPAVFGVVGPEEGSDLWVSPLPNMESYDTIDEMDLLFFQDYRLYVAGWMDDDDGSTSTMTTTSNNTSTTTNDNIIGVPSWLLWVICAVIVVSLCLLFLVVCCISIAYRRLRRKYKSIKYPRVVAMGLNSLKAKPDPTANGSDSVSHRKTASFVVENANTEDLEDRYASELGPANSHRTAATPRGDDSWSSAGDRKQRDTPSGHPLMAEPSRAGSQSDKVADMGDGPPRTPAPYIDFVPNYLASSATGEYTTVATGPLFKVGKDQKELVSSLGRYPSYENVKPAVGRHQSNPGNSPVYENPLGDKMRAHLKMQPLLDLGQKSEASKKPMPLPKLLCQNTEHGISGSSVNSKNGDAALLEASYASTDANDLQSTLESGEVQDQSRASFNNRRSDDYLEQVQLKPKNTD